MILDFGSFVINESSLKKLKKNLHGVLNMSARKSMRKELRDNIITFKFKKRNGEIRTAHGTLHPDYLPKLRGGAPRPEHQMVYYDLDKEGWRSFRSYSFIEILNVKPVEGKSKPVVKEDEEEETKKVAIEKEKEEVKKPIHKEEDEKEVNKPVHKKEDEDVDEDGEKHAYKSPIYDESEDEKKERKEDDEKIEKLKHKDEDVIKKEKEKEKEEKEEKEKDDKEKNEEKKKTNESVTPVEEYPNVTTLGDGEYDGALWGHCFVYEGKKYYSECGWKNIFPSYCKMVIENGKSWAHQVDKYQRESLKKLYQ